MITLSRLGSASSASDYYSANNYYTADQTQETSAWFGRGAEELGLKGKVDEQTFAAVLEGKLPDGSVIAAPGGYHRPGIDLTFSASKSVSLLALLAGDKRLVEALKDSATATLKWAEKNVVEARVWDAQLGRQVPERTGNMVTATFLHDVNRKNEPQLHVHGVVANATKASDGKWHAVKNDEFYRAQHVTSAVHNAELRARVEALGYETVPAREPIDGAFEIKAGRSWPSWQSRTGAARANANSPISPPARTRRSRPIPPAAWSNGARLPTGSASIRRSWSRPRWPAHRASRPCGHVRWRAFAVSVPRAWRLPASWA